MLTPPQLQSPAPKTTAHHLWISAGLCFVVTLMFAFRENITSNELGTLVAAKRFAVPSFLGDDWSLSQFTGPRAPFHFLLYPLIKTLPLVAVSIIGRILGFFVLCYALSGVALRFHLAFAQMLILGGLFVGLDQALAAGEWIFGLIESKVLAYALLWLGTGALLDRSLRRASLYFGLATSAHVLVGGWGSVALVLFVLLQKAGNTRERLQSLGLWLAGGAVGIWVGLSSILEPKTLQSSIDPSAIYVLIRNPHHLDPRQWSLSLRSFLSIPAILAILFALARPLKPHEPLQSPEQQKAQMLARFALCTLLPFALGLFATLLPLGYKIQKYYPYRVGATMALMAGLMLLPHVLKTWMEGLDKTRKAWMARLEWTGAALVLLLSALGARDSLKGLSEFPEGGRLPGPRNEALAFSEACAKLKEQEHPGLLLVAPNQETAAYLSAHPIVVSFKLIPASHDGILEWYRRIVDMKGGSPPKARGHALTDEIDQAFSALSREQYLSLAKRYQGRYLLVRRRDDLDFPRLFENAGWSLFDLYEAAKNAPVQ